MAGGSIRDAIKSYSPKWLQGSVGEKFLYAFGLGCDVLAEKLNQAMRMHIPTYGDPSGLASIGNDRLIPQGPNEPPAAYARRLQLAYDDWQHAGSSRAIMRQVLGYCSPSRPKNITVVGNGTGSTTPWDSYPTGVDTSNNAPSHLLQSPANWIWDQSFAAAWYRIWVILDCTTGGPFAVAPVVGSGPVVGGWKGTVGSTATANDVSSIRALVKLWKPANIQCKNIIISFNSNLFQPQLLTGDSRMPDATWANWARPNNISVEIAARQGEAAYWDGTI